MLDPSRLTGRLFYLLSVLLAASVMLHAQNPPPRPSTIPFTVPTEPRPGERC
ncbi:MAG: hypothetical protein JOY93_07170 [Acidobacteriales bacterium]|nr:hypothetical protein [Terriglobales bacterium]